jgi:serine/threonine protein kinase
MTPERYELVCELFAGALALEPGQREAFLQEACAGDPPLRMEVEEWLANDAKACGEGFLQEPSPLGDMIQLPPAEPPDPMIGRRIDAYEIVRRIGGGGMGEVYLGVRRDDIKLRAAVKLIKRGMDSRDILQRFRNERQILAALRHPNVARFLDGGTTEDRLPYFVMEYIEGKPIDQYCDEKRLTTRQRLELLRQVCAAVHFAHQHGVIHRDLSPDNIRVTEEGVPKLLDFGIAKLINPELGFPPDDGPTRTEYRFMKPEYASPEQVRGEPVTTASDVYSLGVVFYRLLTGHPPYRFKNRLKRDIEVAVCETEPDLPSAVVRRRVEVRQDDGTTTSLTPEQVSEVRDGLPARLRRSLAGEVDKIVLMVLKKEPGRRFQSAEQFAEDIRRHLAGLPLLWAVKDSLLYRLRKLGKRYQVLVGAGVLLLLSLLGGIAGTTVGMFRAWGSEALAKSKEEAAQAAENKALRFANELEETVADGLFRPLGHHHSSINPIELNALRELASQPKGRDRIRLLFLERGLSRPETAERLERRAEIAANAAVGLDRRRRQQVRDLLLSRLRDRGTDWRIRSACISVGAPLLADDREFASEAAPALLEAMARTDHPRDLVALARGAGAVADRLGEAEAAAVARRLFDATAESYDPYGLDSLERGFAAVAGRVGGAEAAGLTRQLLDAMAKTRSPSTRGTLARGLGVVAGQLGRAEAAAVARQLIDAMATDSDQYALFNLARSFEAVAGRLTGSEAAVVTRQLLDAMAKADRPETRGSRARGSLAAVQGAFQRSLRAVADRLDGAEATAVARQLLDAMAKADDPAVLSSLRRGFAAVAGRLGGADATVVTRQLLDAMAKTDRPEARGPRTSGSRTDAQGALQGSLRAVADRLDGAGAAMVAREILDGMAKAKANDYIFQESLRLRFEAVAGRLDGAGAAAVAGQLFDAMTQVKDPYGQGLLARSLGAMAGRLGGADAAAVARQLLDAMEKADDPSALDSLAHSLGAVAGRLGEAEARRASSAAARRLLDAMAKVKSERPFLGLLARGLEAVARELGEAEAADVTRQLFDAMAKAKDWQVRWSLARALDAVAGRVGKADAAALARQFLDAIANAEDPHLLGTLAHSLGAVAGRLGEAEARRASSAAARRLLDAMVRAKGQRADWELARGLDAVVGRVGEAEASAAVWQLLGVMAKADDYRVRKADDYRVREAAARGLGAVAGRVGVADAAAVARQLLKAMAKATDGEGRRQLARALSAVAARVGEADAADVARQLIDPLVNATDPVVLESLGRGLDAVGGRVSAAEAAALVRQVLNAFDKPGNRYIHGLERGLSAVAGRLDRPEAAAAVHRILDAMGDASNWAVLKSLADSLGAVAGRLDDAEARRASAAAARRLVDAMTTGRGYYMGSTLTPALEKVTTRLNRQDLVDLLKHPTCVGPARDIVLRRLGRLANRTFATLWELLDWLDANDPGVDVLTPPAALDA